MKVCVCVCVRVYCVHCSVCTFMRVFKCDCICHKKMIWLLLNCVSVCTSKKMNCFDTLTAAPVFLIPIHSWLTLLVRWLRIVSHLPPLLLILPSSLSQYFLPFLFSRETSPPLTILPLFSFLLPSRPPLLQTFWDYKAERSSSRKYVLMSLIKDNMARLCCCNIILLNM